MPKPIYVLNGPNLNMLGVREPQIYGSATLEDLRTRLEAYATGRNVGIDFRQSNHEGDLVDWVQEAAGASVGMILNAGALTHTSIALMDAIKAVDVPVVEVHLSNIFAREGFRHHSYVSPAAIGIISGFGPKGYEFAVDVLVDRLGGTS